ncbi:hypothetical protein [Snodgrassella sp. CFCC 13594]|uniref:hypothetical protein n=1 Tax=Snodgrassella sp. CFCC 13594 TaxID=1775559 RepID=UPI00082D3B22|nr:hypothetical protein [Snodgrassella sp. CFCC 13594]
MPIQAGNTVAEPTLQRDEGPQIAQAFAITQSCKRIARITSETEHIVRATSGKIAQVTSRGLCVAIVETNLPAVLTADVHGETDTVVKINASHF